MKVEIARRPDIGGHEGHRQPYEGYGLADSDPIRETRVDVRARWKGNPDLSALRGKPVYLRFELVNMGLASFQVTDE